MKHYPSIPRWNAANLDDIVIAFDKLDGSNIRAEWNAKKGFYKFGSKNQLIDETHKPLGEAIDLIKGKYAESLGEVCKEQKWQGAVFFFEFWGPTSFAGFHPPEDDGKRTVTLIDCNVYKRGMLPAQEFLWRFEHLDIPKVLYRGRMSQEFLDSVQDGSLEGMTFEGVVCKDPKDSDFMFKVKNAAWLLRLREQCKDDEQAFESLA